MAKSPTQSQVGSDIQKENPEEKSNKSHKSTDRNKNIDKSDKKEEKSRLKKVNISVSEDQWAEIEKVCKSFKDEENAPKIADKLHSMLEKKYGKGWCVFVGKHYFGIVVHEEKTCAVFEIDDQRVSIFKNYVPEGS